MRPVVNGKSGISTVFFVFLAIFVGFCRVLYNFGGTGRPGDCTCGTVCAVRSVPELTPRFTGKRAKLQVLRLASLAQDDEVRGCARSG
jgi:hypothetical protein